MIIKKLAMIILCILMCAGIVYCFEIFQNPTSEHLNKIFWSILTGIGFAYIMGFELKLDYKIKKPSRD